MKVFILFFLFPLVLSAQGAKEDLITDIITGVVPLTGYVMAKAKGDEEGRQQWVRNTVSNVVVTTGLRIISNSTSWGERPNGNHYGFPSGHVSFVVSGAAFLHERYGWQYGLPAYLLSAYVAEVRVKNDHHHTRDVVVGAALGYALTQLVVTPEKEMNLAPIIGRDFIGLRWLKSW